MALFILSMTLTTPAWSADKNETRQREAQRRAQQAIKQAQSRAVELEQANTDLGSKLKEQEQRVNEVQQNLDGFSRKNKRLAEDYAREQGKAVDLEARLKEAESNLRQMRTELAEVSAAQLETQRHLQTTTSEKTALDETLATCSGKNEKLYQFGRELINHVERPDGFTSILRAEPFTQIKRVELENIFQDYRDSLDQNRMKPLSVHSANPG
jgi:predicted nuclease with TOPRIM domain